MDWVILTGRINTKNRPFIFKLTVLEQRLLAPVELLHSSQRGSFCEFNGFSFAD